MVFFTNLSAYIIIYTPIFEQNWSITQTFYRHHFFLIIQLTYWTVNGRNEDGNGLFKTFHHCCAIMPSIYVWWASYEHLKFNSPSPCKTTQDDVTFPESQCFTFWSYCYIYSESQIVLSYCNASFKRISSNIYLYQGPFSYPHLIIFW